jgi:hypothetical protein
MEKNSLYHGSSICIFGVTKNICQHFVGALLDCWDGSLETNMSYAMVVELRTIPNERLLKTHEHEIIQPTSRHQSLHAVCSPFLAAKQV